MVSVQNNDLVCTLTAADYQDRKTAWLKVGGYVRASETVPGGLSFRFAPTPGLKDWLTELVRLEADCCAWMTLALSQSPDGISLSITSNREEGERAVRESFVELVRTIGPGAPLTT